MQRLSFLIDIHVFLSGFTFVCRECIIALNMLWKGVFVELGPWGSAITGDHLSLLQNLLYPRCCHTQRWREEVATL